MPQDSNSGEQQATSPQERTESRQDGHVTRMPPQGEEPQSEGGFSADRTNPFTSAKRPTPNPVKDTHRNGNQGDGNARKTAQRPGPQQQQSQRQPQREQSRQQPTSTQDTQQGPDATTSRSSAKDTSQRQQGPVTIRPPSKSDNAAMDLLGLSGDGARSTAAPSVADPADAQNQGRPNGSESSNSDTAPSLFGDLQDEDGSTSNEATTSADDGDASAQDQANTASGDSQSTSDGVVVTTEDGQPVQYRGVPDEQVPESQQDALFISQDGRHVYGDFTSLTQAHEELLQHKNRIESENSQVREEYSDANARLEALKQREQELLDVLNTDAVVDRMAKKHMPEEYEGKTVNDFTSQDDLDDFKYHQRRAREQAQEELEELKSETVDDRAESLKSSREALEERSKEAMNFMEKTLTPDFLGIQSEQDKKALLFALQSYASDDDTRAPQQVYRMLHNTYVQSGPEATKLQLLGLQRHVQLMREHMSREQGGRVVERQPSNASRSSAGVRSASGNPPAEVDVADMNGRDAFMQARR